MFGVGMELEHPERLGMSNWGIGIVQKAPPLNEQEGHHRVRCLLKEQYQEDRIQEEQIQHEMPLCIFKVGSR